MAAAGRAKIVLRRYCNASSQRKQSAWQLLQRPSVPLPCFHSTVVLEWSPCRYGCSTRAKKLHDMLTKKIVAVLIGLLIPAAWIGLDSAILADEIDFNRDVRPILSEHCFQCHGPDANQRQTDLRFDVADSMFADLGGYAAFVPGDPESSEALRRIYATDLDELMPPRESKLELNDSQREILTAWVRQGAKWSRHWAMVPPVKPPVPEVGDTSWPRNVIDRFVLARMEQSGWHPNPEADRTTLIRRVTLDLTGLPPTPDEVDAFLNDESVGAYEKLVDRLLDSPRYGERMAWDWLDAARYADTDGFQADPTREMWPWRDWLVRALNDNMPFDQFTIEMLAGDLLPGATREQVIATAFNRNHMYNGEGGRIPEETRIENVFDRTETTATVWLGLTMTCARCHDHKFDPITQQEYYQLFAFFNNTSESGAGGSGKAGPTLNYLTPDQTDELNLLEKEVAELTQQMNAPDEELDGRQLQWESKTRTALGQQEFDKEIVSLDDWWVLGPFPAPETGGGKSFDTDFGPETGVDLDRQYGEENLRWQRNSDFVDGKTHALPDRVGATYLFRRLDTPRTRTVSLSLGSDDAIRVWHNGKPVLSNNTARGVAPDQEQLSLQLTPGKHELLIKIVNTGGAAGFYFKKQSETVLGLPSPVAAALVVEPGQRTEPQRGLIREHFRSLHSQSWQALRRRQAELNAERQRIQQSAASVMIMDELPEEKRRDSFVLERGVYTKPLQSVVQNTPAFLPPLSDNRPPDRLSLARWIVSDDNPLTARVTVNRYWQLFFGDGLVRTAENFGRQGEMPSHPKLLDYLARTFVESGWNVKQMHKRIVMSATYRQSSSSKTTGQSSYEMDPENRWLTRGPRFRMPSWMLRDQALALGGLLVERRGGPPVNPYQPDGIWAEATFGKINYQRGSGEDLYRRSLYTFWRRIVGPTMFFDTGKRQTCIVKPPRTNSPMHALTTLNETTFVESARGMAARVLARQLDPVSGDQSGLDGRRLQYAFRLATARWPTAGELELLTTRLTKLRREYQKNDQAAQQLLSVGESPRDDALPLADHAALTVICSMIMNLDEVLTKE